MLRERRISKNVKAVLGHDDGHVDIVVSLPWPASVVKESVELRIEPDEIPIAEEILMEARQHLREIRRGK
jgi:hypothetical protein